MLTSGPAYLYARISEFILVSRLVFARLSAHCAYRRVYSEAGGFIPNRWFYPESIILSRITSVNHEENEEKGGMMEEEGEEGGKEGTKGGREGER